MAAGLQGDADGPANSLLALESFLIRNREMGFDAGVRLADDVPRDMIAIPSAATCAWSSSFA